MRGLLIALAMVCAGMAPAQEFTTLKGHGGPIMGIAVSGEGRVATASFDNSVGLWQGRVPVWLEGHEAAVNVVDFWQDRFPVSAGDDYTVRVWIDPDHNRIIGRHKGKVTGLALSRQAGLVASASWDGTIGLWPLAAEMTDAPMPGEAGDLLTGHDQGVNAVVFSADGGRLYSGSVDGTIRVWDVAARAGIRQLVRHGFGVNKMVLDEAGGWLAYGAVDGVTRIVDAQSGETLRDFTLERRPILAMAHHPGTGQLAVGDGEGFIMVIDTRDWRITRDFRATRAGPVWALAFSRDGAVIHAGGLDDVAYAWPVAALDAFEPGISGARSFLRDPGEMSNGERQFMRKCSICHALEDGASRKAGPSLHGLFGRRAGTVPGYGYSGALAGSAIVWSDETVDALFDQGPDHYIPGSKMPMQVIAGAGDRADLIDFLRTATTAGETR